MTDTPELVEQPAGETANDLVRARLRTEMARQGITAPQLAGRMAAPKGAFWSSPTLDEQWVQRRAAGRTQMTLTDVQWLAAALEIPMAALLADLIPPNWQPS